MNKKIQLIIVGVSIFTAGSLLADPEFRVGFWSDVIRCFKDRYGRSEGHEHVKYARRYLNQAVNEQRGGVVSRRTVARGTGILGGLFGEKEEPKKAKAPKKDTRPKKKKAVKKPGKKVPTKVKKTTPRKKSVISKKAKTKKRPTKKKAAASKKKKKVTAKRKKKAAPKKAAKKK